MLRTEGYKNERIPIAFHVALVCQKKASERPLGGFGALPPVNTYAPGMRRPTQNGLSQKTKKAKANNTKKESPLRASLYRAEGYKNDGFHGGIHKNETPF